MLEPDLIAPLRLRPLRRVEYDRLVAEGAFGDEKLELLRGTLVAMSPQGHEHARVVMILNRLLVLALGTRAFVRPQLPLALSEDSEPEPDLAVVETRDLTDGHPGSATLVIEVADSSVNADRNVKAVLYAEAGIPEFWLIDLGRRRVEVYRSPAADRFSDVKVFERDAVLAPAAYPDVHIALSDFL